MAQAQFEEETEGTEELDGSGEADAPFEAGPEDTEAEREEPDTLLDEPPTPTSVAPPADETTGRAPATTAPGVLNAPGPTVPPPPSDPLPPPAGEDGASLPPERSLGRQPTPPRLDPGAPGLRLELRAPKRPGAREVEPRTPERSGRVDLDPPPAAGGTLRPLPPPSMAPPGRVNTTAQEAEPPGIRTGARSPAGYRVRPGDSLWSIAEAQLGPGAESAEVAREVGRLWPLNGERIGTGEPDLIMPDTVLRLR